MNFNNLKSLRIPEGNVKSITFPDGSVFTFGGSSEDTYPYTKVNYVYIDTTTATGYSFQANTKIQLSFKPSNFGGKGWLGKYCRNDTNDWRFFGAGNNIYLDLPNNTRIETTTRAYSTNTNYQFEIGNRYIKDLKTENIIIQGTACGDSYWTGTQLGSDFTEMYLRRGYPSTSGDNLYIEWLKIYEGDTLVRDYQAVKLDDTSSSSGALYDSITKTYLGGNWNVTEYS